MAKILALDTSTDACSVALSLDGEIHEDFRVIPRQHTKELLPMIDALLKASSITVNDLDAIAFGRGPGSFAGIRIATGVAQGLAFGAGIALLPVSTLAALALAQHRKGYPQVVSVLDARMNEVYWGAYQEVDGLPQLIGDERVDAPANVRLPNDKSLADASSWLGAGAGWCYKEDMSSELTDAVTQIEKDVYPSAADMVRIAVADWKQGKAVAPEEALPVYLRDDVAWKKKDQQ